MRPPRPRRRPLQEALRAAVRRSGLSRRELARRAGVGVGAVSRLADGERGVTLDTAERLAKVLGLALGTWWA